MRDPALEEVVALRAATRAIVETPGLTGRQKLLAILELRDRADRADLLEWARQVIWTEARAFLGKPPDPPPRGPGDPVERACRSLVAKGLIRCPSCARPLPTKIEFARWDRLRRRMVEEAERRELGRSG